MNQKPARSYQSPLITKYLQNIDQHKLNRTRNRMLMTSVINEKIKENCWTKKHMAVNLNISCYELDKWLSGTHDFSQEDIRLIQNILKTEHA